MSEEQKPDFVSPDKKFYFYENTHDGPDGYSLMVGNTDHLYIHSRTLSDLTNPLHATGLVMQCLEAMCGGGVLQMVLEKHGLTPEQLHIALLQLRIRRQEKETQKIHDIPVQGFGSLIEEL